MRRQYEILTVLMTGAICVYSFFSAVNIGAGTICGACGLLLTAAVILNAGRIRIRSVYRKWLFNITCVFVCLFSSRQPIHAYNLYLFMLILMSIAVFSSPEKINLEIMMKTLVFFSSVTINGVLLEAVFKKSFLSLLSPFLSWKKLYMEQIRISRKNGYYGLSEYPNVISVAAAILLFYSLWLSNKTSRIRKYMLLAASMIGLIITGERSNLILVPAAGLFVYYICGNKDRTIRALKIMGIFTILVAAFFLMRTSLEKIRMFSRVYTSVDTFFAGNSILGVRERMNSICIALWKRKPIFGNGWFYFFYSHKGILHGGTYSHAHNFVLELLCDGGITGLLLALNPIVSSIVQNIKMIKRGRRKDKNVYKFTLALQVLYVLDSMLHVTFYNLNMIGIYFVIILLFQAKSAQQGRGNG